MNDVDLKLARASLMAYHGHEGIREALSIKDVYDISNPDTSSECYVGIDDNSVYVVFRGTQEVTDFWTDLKAFKSCGGKYRIHWGFLNSYLSVQESLLHYLKDNMNKKVYFTGHSLGGALAVVGGLMTYLPNKEIVTFGQPRIGDLKVARELDTLNYRRYVNHADIVCRIPRINFFHGGGCYYLNGNNELVINPTNWYKFKDRVGSWSNGIEDHSINEYIRKIEFSHKSGL